MNALELLKSPGQTDEGLDKKTNNRRWLGVVVGVVLAVVVYIAMPADLDNPPKITAATAVLMGVWWMTEAIPIPATALVPVLVFPVAHMVDSEGETIDFDGVGASYGNNIIFLFMGGFLIALAMQRWNLHRRIALHIVRMMGGKSQPMIGGFMIATGFISMWVSNTATAVMMLPLGTSVLALVSTQMKKAADSSDTSEGKASDVIRTNFGTALMLGIAYSASLGSLATIIGTPPNTLLVGYLASTHDIHIGFGEWMLVGLPLAVIFTFLCWFLLTHILFKPEMKEIPGGRELVADELRKLGPMASGEKLVLTIFVLAAVSWIFIPVIFEDPPISDAGIAMTAGMLLFLIPARANRGVKLLDWESAAELPWGVLLLFGGGLALSAQFTNSGLSEWIGEQAEAVGVLPVILIVAIITTLIIFLTELTSNTATAATFLPVVGGVAMGVGLDPMLLTIPTALAATCAFMLPVATPPNAVAYGSGYVTIGSMIKGGIWLNVIGIVLVTATTMTLAVWVFGISY
ncbi:SLC13 family permease [Paramicrobacterium chengjingii]|uniref:Sodium-dependent dicarboxylate transporter SdcS n=1 Tax=Paramicrobacterium chengjingii TaxID=2769067 RepID=A0ABX6YL33_9MICO|nr:DASS family sodium-coupled anion symporter [Microbacterium chengjingii]QPZ39440.1 DASS family sodium-coupled anion symporter [Microbacterium chengjingii]